MTGTPKPMAVRDGIAESIWANVKSYDVEAWCVSLGLAPAADGEDPFRSKRTYLKSRLAGLDMTRLVALAQRLLEEWDDEALQALVDAASSARGVDGAMRNLIFASTGPKPRIVLRDAIDNVVEIVENGQFCLYYDRALGNGGLRWADMVAWWADLLATNNLDGRPSRCGSASTSRSTRVRNACCFVPTHRATPPVRTCLR